MELHRLNTWKLAFLLLPLLPGCATTQGGGALALPQIQIPTLQMPPIKIDVSDFTDSFSAQMRDIKKLVADDKFDEAELFFYKEQAFFDKRFSAQDAPLPAEIKSLTENIWTVRYKSQVAATTAQLAAVDAISGSDTWPAISRAMETAEKLSTGMEASALIQLGKQGIPEKNALDAQHARVLKLAEANRPKAFASTFGPLLDTGKLEPRYIASDSFAEKEYVASAEFQAMALARMGGIGDREARFRQADALGPYLSPATRTTVDSDFVALLRKELMADGQISLEEVFSLGGFKTPFGGGSEALGRLVSIGYVDLSGAAPGGRGAADFPIAFERDLPFPMEQADSTVLDSREASRFDYIFVTDPAQAQAAREFRDKKEIGSRTQTGTRVEPNPDYIMATSNYQQAMAQYQAVQIKGAMPTFCRGWGCVLQGVSDGIEQSAAQGNLNRASAMLANTSQTITLPVYSAYSYQSVAIATSKTAKVNYYVVDVKKKRVLASSFQSGGNEVFNVLYNVTNEDPDRARIMSQSRSEDDVLAWEKQPVPVSLRALFSGDGLRSASPSAYPEFLARLKQKNMPVPVALRTSTAAALSAPVATPTAMAIASSSGDGPGNGTIADDRFGSIVVLKNARASGAGFYVAPDLVLTAYHVVDASPLVEITLYDGSKSVGKVVDHDLRLDLAIIKTPVTGKPMKIYEGPVKLGESVEAIGHPKGYNFTITRGVISAMRKQRGPAIGSDSFVEFVQTDTPISPGNSGGPLLLKDSVIGVNDWARVDKGAQNLNFGVSYNEIREYLDRYARK